MLPTISVVVPVRNGEKTIGDCIESILRVDYPRDRCDCVVVNNSSTDRTAEIVSRLPVTLLYQPKRGAAAARNAGVRFSRSDYVAFTDADCVVDRRWLPELVAGFDDEGIACVGGEISSPPPANDIERYCNTCNPISQENAMREKVLLFPHAITANAMFRRRIFESVGFFDERFPSAGGEDLDLGWRIHWAGHRMRYVPSARVEHRHKSRLGQLFRQHFRYGYASTLIVRKHAGLYRDTAPSCAGVYYDDIRALRASLRELFRLAWSEGMERETRFKFYQIVRQLGEYSGKFAAAVSS